MLTYCSSNMILAVHSNTSYLSKINAPSLGSHFFLSHDDPVPPNNGSILTVAQVIKAVMTSAAEAKLAALYINSREVIYICHILAKMGHIQPGTPVQTDNFTAEGVVNNKILPKQTKAMDMRFHWLKCR